MAANLVTKIFTADSLWTCPSNVKVVKIFGTTPSFSNNSVQGGSTSGTEPWGMGVNSTGTVYTWGDNTFGQLGNNSSGSSTSFPAPIVGGLVCSQVGAGFSSSGVLDINGNAWMWGSNLDGSLGDGTNTNRSSPVQVIGGLKFIQIAVGGNSSVGVGFGLTSTGDVWSWGENATTGGLGDGTTTNRSSPVQVIGGLKFVQIAANRAGCGGLTASGDLYTWGENTQGQLGDGTTVSKSSPVKVIGGLKFTQISAPGNGDGQNFYGIDVSGNAWAWGRGTTFGALGDGTIVSKSSPVQVVGGLKFVQIAASNDGARALTAAGQVYTWGVASGGALGDNSSNTNRSSPVLVVGALRFVQVFRGAEFRALATDGNLYTCGTNASGELGTGDGNGYSSPVQVAGGLSFQSVTPTVQKYVFNPTPGTTYSIKLSSALKYFGPLAVSNQLTQLTLQYFS